MLEKFLNKTERVHNDLGATAAAYYIVASVKDFKSAMRQSGEVCQVSRTAEKDAVMTSLCQTVEGFTCDCEVQDSIPKVSVKFERLLHILCKTYTPAFCGIIFVEQRATVLTLYWLLSRHPTTKERFKCGTFVGMSNHELKRMKLGDLLDPRLQPVTLNDFRKGKLNLIIATNALEEGIDISACNVVICFDEPRNLKSFIQRRGRARTINSKYVVLSADGKSRAKAEEWRKLEEEMITACQDQNRGVDPNELDVSSIQYQYDPFLIPSTKYDHLVTDRPPS